MGHYFVFYDQLVTNPVEEIEHLCKFVDVIYNNDILNRVESGCPDLIKYEEEWKKNDLIGIHYTGHLKFEALFNDKEKDHIRNHVINYKNLWKNV
jgi:hypothetical protein